MKNAYEIFVLHAGFDPYTRTEFRPNALADTIIVKQADPFAGRMGYRIVIDWLDESDLQSNIHKIG